MKSIRTVIVDDERLARQRIRRLLKDEPDFEVVGEFARSGEIPKLWQELQPDLLFLDIQMPRINGFDMLKQWRGEATPLVIFVTAYEQYALKAFEVHAYDYLLKPFDESRFRAALDRVRALLPSATEGSALNFPPVLQPVENRSARQNAVLVRSAGKARLLKTAEIDWIESADNYVNLHAGRESYLVRETMTAFEAKLPKENFARIHRSIIVNTDRIFEFHNWFNGDYVVVLKDGQKLRMSRTYRERVQDLFGQSI